MNDVDCVLECGICHDQTAEQERTSIQHRNDVIAANKFETHPSNYVSERNEEEEYVHRYRNINTASEEITKASVGDPPPYSQSEIREPQSRPERSKYAYEKHRLGQFSFVQHLQPAVFMVQAPVPPGNSAPPVQTFTPLQPNFTVHPIESNAQFGPQASNNQLPKIQRNACLPTFHSNIQNLSSPPMQNLHISPNIPNQGVQKENFQCPISGSNPNLQHPTRLRNQNIPVPDVPNTNIKHNPFPRENLVKNNTISPITLVQSPQNVHQLGQTDQNHTIQNPPLMNNSNSKNLSVQPCLNYQKGQFQNPLDDRGQYYPHPHGIYYRNPTDLPNSNVENCSYVQNSNLKQHLNRPGPHGQFPPTTVNPNFQNPQVLSTSTTVNPNLIQFPYTAVNPNSRNPHVQFPYTTVNPNSQNHHVQFPSRSVNSNSLNSQSQFHSTTVIPNSQSHHAQFPSTSVNSNSLNPQSQFHSTTVIPNSQSHHAPSTSVNSNSLNPQSQFHSTTVIPNSQSHHAKFPSTTVNSNSLNPQSQFHSTTVIPNSQSHHAQFPSTTVNPNSRNPDIRLQDNLNIETHNGVPTSDCQYFSNFQYPGCQNITSAQCQNFQNFQVLSNLSLPQPSFVANSDFQNILNVPLQSLQHPLNHQNPAVQNFPNLAFGSRSTLSNSYLQSPPITMGDQTFNMLQAPNMHMWAHNGSIESGYGSDILNPEY